MLMNLKKFVLVKKRRKKFKYNNFFTFYLKIKVSSNAGVSAMPSFFVYKEGKVVDQLIGASKEKLEALVKNYN